jgi:hypothetical protein
MCRTGVRRTILFIFFTNMHHLSIINTIIIFMNNFISARGGQDGRPAQIEDVHNETKGGWEGKLHDCLQTKTFNNCF